MWIGNVALLAFDDQRGVDRTASSVFDDIAQCCRARGLADHAPVDGLATRLKRFDHVTRTVYCWSLFIRCNQISNTSFVVRVTSDERFGSDHHRSQARFHISSPPAIQQPVPLCWNKGITVPLL